MASFVKVVAVLILCMLVVTEPYAAEAAVTCGLVSSNLSPCIAYLTRGPRPSRACCGGLRRLLGAARTTRDRRTACTCLKQAAGYIRGINFRKAAGLPRACGVRIPYVINPRTNCARVR